MSIAQLLVAGEGVAHPCEAESLLCATSIGVPTAPLLGEPLDGSHQALVCIEASTALSVHSVPSAYSLDSPADRLDDSFEALPSPQLVDATNLPWVIFRAAHRASQLQGILPRARAVLAALARTVNAADPFGAIFARRELLTGRAMQSIRTFYRSLDDLESAGLISRTSQRRYVEAGLFGRAYIHLTEHAAHLLGLTDDVRPASTSEPRKTLPDPGTTHAARTTHGVSLDSPCATVADGGIYKDLDPSFNQKRQPGTPPADLTRLQRLGFHRFLIFRLMREAREHGKRLSDIVEVAWEHIKAARTPINYLRALIRGHADFAFQRRQRDTAASQQADRQAQLDDAIRVAAHSAGQAFITADGLRRIEVDVTGQQATLTDAHEGVARMMGSGWREGFARAMTKGTLRRMTPEDGERFAQARRVSLDAASHSRPASAWPVPMANLGGASQPVPTRDAMVAPRGEPARERGARVLSPLAMAALSDLRSLRGLRRDRQSLVCVDGLAVTADVRA